MSDVFVLLILSMAPLGMGIPTVHTFRKYRAALRLKASGVETTGLCTLLSSREDYVSVHFSYTAADGTERDAVSSPMRYQSLSPGDTVTIVYVPDSPETAELARDLEDARKDHRHILWFALSW
ncbi:DUF3592 domain-containing protein [Streptomyces sp. MBT53]|uniref:DUF3592 domain-containing protein n=1 Tax=Streptomyces sp. MBT53 TaxID=1488384 RepID=UPI001911D3EA|nr:DUF3592 domain-containing protein [Streptomyces sp. MBT53]MBK6015648.1 hypothetical protein [Streptomyces sp. MBT53]